MFGRQVTLELKVIDGTPMVKTFEFAHSTFQQAAASKYVGQVDVPPRRRGGQVSALVAMPICRQIFRV